MEKENYLSVIRKSDFVDLFKYGWLNIGWAVPFDGDMNAHHDDDLFDKLTNRMNLFEYSFEYLIIHFASETTDCIDIKEVQGIYAFNAEAKREMGNSFDPRIRIRISLWADKMQKYCKEMFVKQSLRGVDNLWAIFGLTDEDKAKCKGIITHEIVDEVFRELFENERPAGNLPLWVYLLRYERHSFYPRDMRGFFCDCIHTVCNWSKKIELMDGIAETTEVYRPLMSCEQKFEPLSKIMLSSPLASMTEQPTNCRFVVAAPLFLFLKDKFLAGIKGRNEEMGIIDYAKEIGGFECSLAVYLLGLTLGYDKTYDAYYDAVRLPIFKEKSHPAENEPEPIVPTQEGSPSSQATNEGCEGLSRPPLATMYKGRKGTKNYVCREVYTQDELEKLKNLGYKAYKSNSKRKRK